MGSLLIKVYYVTSRDNYRAIACSIKGDVKEHFSPCTGGADIFRDIQPSDHGRRLPGVVPWVVLFHINEFFFSVATTRDGFGNGASRIGRTVSTMVLSEARGLVLFRVVRGGIGFTQRLGAQGTVVPTGV